jgi:hypothetical protein
MRIQDYKVCVAPHPEEFEKMVKTAIREGWQPYGTMIYTGVAYAQAMVRFAELGQPAPSMIANLSSNH